MKFIPEILKTPNGEKYFKLLRTLPIRDQEECRMVKAPQTLETLTGFLRSKLRDRKHGGSLGHISVKSFNCFQIVILL